MNDANAARLRFNGGAGGSQEPTRSALKSVLAECSEKKLACFHC